MVFTCIVLCCYHNKPKRQWVDITLLHQFINEQMPGSVSRAQSKAQSLPNPWFSCASAVANNRKVHLHSTVAFSCYLQVHPSV